MSIEEIQAADELTWNKRQIRRIPNILTGLRLLAVPFFVVILCDPSESANLWAAVIFGAASVTDYLDGYLARKLNAHTILGTLLDPLADKILVLAALVMLVADPAGPRVPAWMVIVLIAREMLVNSLRGLAATQGKVVPASYGAKHKTAWTMVGLLFLLIGCSYEVLGVMVNFPMIGMVFLWVALVLSVATAVHYFYSLRSVYLSSPT